MLTKKNSLNSNENLQNENKSSQKEPVSQTEVVPIVIQEIIYIYVYIYNKYLY